MRDIPIYFKINPCYAIRNIKDLCSNKTNLYEGVGEASEYLHFPTPVLILWGINFYHKCI